MHTKILRIINGVSLDYRGSAHILSRHSRGRNLAKRVRVVLYISGQVPIILDISEIQVIDNHFPPRYICLSRTVDFATPVGQKQTFSNRLFGRCQRAFVEPDGVRSVTLFQTAGDFFGVSPPQHSGRRNGPAPSEIRSAKLPERFHRCDY